MQTRTETAIVILNWNGRAHLEKFLPSVWRHSQQPGTEIYVADNGSDDDSVSFLKYEYPEISLLIFDKNYGFAGGYNKALEQIDADFFVILNSDVEVSENWLEAPIKMLKSNPKAAAAAPKILSFTQKDTFEYAGAAGGFIDKLGYPFCRGRILNHVEKDTGQYNETSEIFWASGAALFVKADVFKEMQGFDADFFAHMEEIDLCWRLKNKGYKIMYCPDSFVWHLGGGALPKESPFKVYLNHRNNLKMLYKNLPRNKVFLTLFQRLFLDGLSAIIYLASLKFSFFASVIKAHFAFYRNINNDKKKRRFFSEKERQTFHSEIYPKSIVAAYFLKNKKYFKDLNFYKKKQSG